MSQKNVLEKIANQIFTFFQGLSSEKKVGVLFLAFFTFSTLIGIVFWSFKQTYVPFVSQINPEDVSQVMKILREKRIPFKVDETGKNILVHPENLYELKIELAGLGLPQSGVMGYEIFDQQALGTTSFIQKMNQKRALEGELIRTINSIRGVARSRVHLALPQKSSFLEDQKKPSASVVVDLEPGVSLTDRQIQGIGHLVARAVEGMDIADVMILNAEGKVLSKNPTDLLSATTATQFDYQQKLESDLEKRIEDLMSRVVGSGKVVAKVTADLDFSQVQETQTVYDSDGVAIRSIEKQSDSMNGTRPGPVGAPGSVSNTPGGSQDAANQVKTATSKNNEVTNYEIPQIVRKTTRSTGTIKRLSVAVLLDAKITQVTGEAGKIEKKVENWSSEKLKEFEQLVTSSVGLNLKRGDTLEIKSIEFTKEDLEEANRILVEKDQKHYIQNMLIYAIVACAILLFFFFVIRPFMKWMIENTVESVDSFLPKTLEELEKIQKGNILPNLDEAVPILAESLDPEKVEGDMIREKIITLVDSNPHKAALILRDWLHGEFKKKEEKKDEKGVVQGFSKAAS